MSALPTPAGWSEANQRLLGAELAGLRHRIEQFSDVKDADDSAAFEQAIVQARNDMPADSAIDMLCALFGLSGFERQLLLLCCGIELDANIASACARINGQMQAQRNVSFGLALAVLPEAHWSALTPMRPLRYWHLLEVEYGLRLSDSPLRIDERILHFVAGINVLDTRLRSLLRSHAPSRLMPESHVALAERIARHLDNAGNGATRIRLDGSDPRGQHDVAAAVAERHGLRLLMLRGDELPTSPVELEQLQMLWDREARLSPVLLFLMATDSAHAGTSVRFVEALQSPIIFSMRETALLQRSFISFSVDKPLAIEQKQLWLQALGTTGRTLNGELDVLSGQFRLSAHAIESIAESISDDATAADAGRELWHACRRIGHDRLNDLAERIEPSAVWDDLILPPAQHNTLRQIAAHLRQRIRVYEDWGFARHCARGLGISALFCGESGTGKTMAAEVLANELKLDLYRIDLSAVVSKYIGETEKNLRRVFDAAEDSGAILLFDEADALFGKRSEVKDSHDRYANIEVSYLLQRMEAYRGLAILTSNIKSALDRAFQRRLRFIVNFPFPENTLREAIWRRAFPPNAPTRDIHYARLARLNLPGGNIRNIALNAAFLAAEAGEALDMTHLLHAARSESAKLERPLSEAETRGWV